MHQIIFSNHQRSSSSLKSSLRHTIGFFAPSSVASPDHCVFLSFCQSKITGVHLFQLIVRHLIKWPQFKNQVAMQRLTSFLFLFLLFVFVLCHESSIIWPPSTKTNIFSGFCMHQFAHPLDSFSFSPSFSSSSYSSSFFSSFSSSFSFSFSFSFSSAFSFSSFHTLPLIITFFFSSFISRVALFFFIHSFFWLACSSFFLYICNFCEVIICVHFLVN